MTIVILFQWIIYFIAKYRTMVAQVPVSHVPTLYAKIGDLFGWLSLVSFGLMLVWGVMAARKMAAGKLK